MAGTETSRMVRTGSAAFVKAEATRPVANAVRISAGRIRLCSLAEIRHKTLVQGAYCNFHELQRLRVVDNLIGFFATGGSGHLCGEYPLDLLPAIAVSRHGAVNLSFFRYIHHNNALHQ